METSIWTKSVCTEVAKIDVVCCIHIHLIARWNHNLGLGRTIMAFKGIIAKRHAIEWQQGFFDHRIRSSGELRAKTAYVRDNPVRAGLVVKAVDWPYAYLYRDENG